MTELRKGDADLHHPDGRHKDRFDFPFEFEKYERRIELHLMAHERKGHPKFTPDQHSVLDSLTDLAQERATVDQLIRGVLRSGRSVDVPIEDMAAALAVAPDEAWRMLSE